jgi:hypothetical protein
MLDPWIASARCSPSRETAVQPWTASMSGTAATRRSQPLHLIVRPRHSCASRQVTRGASATSRSSPGAARLILAARRSVPASFQLDSSSRPSRHGAVSPVAAVPGERFRCSPPARASWRWGSARPPSRARSRLRRPPSRTPRRPLRRRPDRRRPQRPRRLRQRLHPRRPRRPRYRPHRHRHRYRQPRQLRRLRHRSRPTPFSPVTRWLRSPSASGPRPRHFSRRMGSRIRTRSSSARCSSFPDALRTAVDIPGRRSWPRGRRSVEAPARSADTAHHRAGAP